MHHLVLVALAGTMLFLAGRHPALFQALSREDGWVEWATFLAFLTAFALAAARAARLQGRGADRLALAGMALFCFFVAGEEISWGQRLFGFRPAEVFLAHNYQQEANLHNLLNDVLDMRWLILAIAVAYGIVSPVIGRWAHLPSACSPTATLVPWFAFVAVTVFLFPSVYAGEFLELVLGAVFVVDVTDRRARTGEGSGAHAGAIMLLWVLAGAVLAVPVADSVTLRRAGALVPQARRELESLRGVVGRPDALRPRALATGTVHKRMFTAVQDQYLSIPVGGHFLDPWNQAYWLLYSRTGAHTARALIYSYGPNRRRDTNVLRLLSSATSMEELLQGDDLGVAVDLHITRRDGRPALSATEREPVRALATRSR